MRIGLFPTGIKGASLQSGCRGLTQIVSELVQPGESLSHKNRKRCSDNPSGPTRTCTVSAIVSALGRL